MKKTHWILCALLSLASVATLVFHSTDSVARGGSAFYVPVGRSELMTTSVPMGEVIVADPAVADIYVHGRNKVSVIGKMVGTTTVRVFDQKSQVLRSANVVVTYDLPAIRKALRDFLPYERISVNMVNTRVALSGDVSSAEAAKTAVELAEQYVATTVGEIKGVRKGLQVGEEKSPIINLMKITAGQQVMLRIRVGEIQRSAIKNLGVSLKNVRAGTFDFSIGTGLGRTGSAVADVVGATDLIAAARNSAIGAALAGAIDPTNPTPSEQALADAAGSRAAAAAANSNASAAQVLSGTQGFGTASDAFGTIGAGYQGTNFGISAQLDALERKGLFKVLAEPNLVALSGEQAEFLAGGEFPIPVPQDQETITIEYKPFGVAVKFTPLVLSENRIRIQVQPEVSEVSSERAIQIAGFTAPSFNTRRASTTVELAPGESFMIAGLIKDSLVSQVDQMPGIAEIPILSALFRSTAYQRNETELVLAVTPYIVDPLKSGDVKLPTDDFRPASFMESIFFGALSAQPGIGEEKPSLEGPSGYMTD